MSTESMENKDNVDATVAAKSANEDRQKLIVKNRAGNMSGRELFIVSQIYCDNFDFYHGTGAEGTMRNKNRSTDSAAKDAVIAQIIASLEEEGFTKRTPRAIEYRIKDNLKMARRLLREHERKTRQGLDCVHPSQTASKHIRMFIKLLLSHEIPVRSSKIKEHTGSSKIKEHRRINEKTPENDSLNAFLSQTLSLVELEHNEETSADNSDAALMKQETGIGSFNENSEPKIEKSERSEYESVCDHYDLAILEHRRIQMQIRNEEKRATILEEEERQIKRRAELLDLYEKILKQSLETDQLVRQNVLSSAEEGREGPPPLINYADRVPSPCTTPPSHCTDNTL